MFLASVLTESTEMDKRPIPLVLQLELTEEGFFKKKNIVRGIQSQNGSLYINYPS